MNDATTNVPARGVSSPDTPRVASSSVAGIPAPKAGRFYLDVRCTGAWT